MQIERRIGLLSCEAADSNEDQACHGQGDKNFDQGKSLFSKD